MKPIDIKQILDDILHEVTSHPSSYDYYGAAEPKFCNNHSSYVCIIHRKTFRAYANCRFIQLLKC